MILFEDAGPYHLLGRIMMCSRAFRNLLVLRAEPAAAAVMHTPRSQDLAGAHSPHPVYES